MPEVVKVSILDLNVESGLGQTLRRILESSEKPQVHLQEISPEIGAPAISGHAVAAAVAEYKSDVIFLVLSPDSLKQAKEIIGCLGEKLGLPVMLVKEAQDPEDMIELLKLRVADFIIPPLRKIDILSRLWRVLEESTPDQEAISFLKEKQEIQGQKTVKKA